MKDNVMNILCIILAIILVGIIIRATTNQGKLWDGDEYYQSCCRCDGSNSRYCMRCNKCV